MHSSAVKLCEQEKQHERCGAANVRKPKRQRARSSVAKLRTQIRQQARIAATRPCKHNTQLTKADSRNLRVEDRVTLTRLGRVNDNPHAAIICKQNS